MSFEELPQADGKTLLAIELRKGHQPRHPSAACPHCQEAVHYPKVLLDDTFNCAFKCLHCDAYMFLDGYDDRGMRLSLPDAEEIRRNNLPSDTPMKKG